MAHHNLLDLKAESSFLNPAGLVAWGDGVAKADGQREARTIENSIEPDLQVSVGDFRVVVEAPPWAWGISQTNRSPGTVAREGEPGYIRPPRFMPVHATIPNLVRHPVTGDMVLIYSPYHDASTEYRMSGICVSRDGGWTWTPPRLVRSLGNVGACGRQWISLSYRTGYDPDHPNRVRVCVQRSPDGLHWTADKPEAVISFPKNMQPQPAWGPQGGGANNDNAQSCRGLYRCPATVYIHKRIEEHEAALYACAYGQFGKDGPWRNFLIRSDDRGKSWSFFADIGRKYEPDFCRLANGEMIAEGRCGYVEPRVLLQTRSTDGGRTWSQPVPAPGVETVSRADRRWFTPTGELFYECSGGNVDPVLLLMGNGVLALSYGRPGLSLRFSVDGTGNHWDHRTTILPKYAVTDGQPWAFPVGSHYCHSYSGMVPLSDCTFLLVSNIYGYSPGGDPHKGRDVVFVVPVSLRKAGRPNARPQLTGPRNVLCQPGREILVRFQLSDPDGDWVQLVCPDTSDVQIRGNAIAWRVPWEFKGRREITLVAEDAWAARSAGHLLTIRKAE